MGSSISVYDYSFITLVGKNPILFVDTQKVESGDKLITEPQPTSKDPNACYKLIFTTDAEVGTIKYKIIDINGNIVENSITTDGTQTEWETDEFAAYITYLEVTGGITEISAGIARATTRNILTNFRLSNHYVGIINTGVGINWTVWGRISNNNLNVPYVYETALDATLTNQNAGTTYPIPYSLPIGAMRLEAVLPQPNMSLVWAVGTQQIK